MKTVHDSRHTPHRTGNKIFPRDENFVKKILFSEHPFRANDTLDKESCRSEHFLNELTILKKDVLKVNCLRTILNFLTIYFIFV